MRFCTVVLLRTVVDLLWPLLRLCDGAAVNNQASSSFGKFLIRPSSATNNNTGNTNILSSSHSNFKPTPTVDTSLFTTETDLLDITTTSPSDLDLSTTSLFPNHDIRGFPVAPVAPAETSSTTPTDMFPEFLPMDNTTTGSHELLGAADDIAVGSGDGEIPDVTVTVGTFTNIVSDTTFPENIATTTEPFFTEKRPEQRFEDDLLRSITSQESATEMTTTSPRPMMTTSSWFDQLDNSSLPTFTSTRSPFGMYKYRESRIIESPVSGENQAAVTLNRSNGTSLWQLPYLPEQRNPESGKENAVEKNLEGHPEGWTPFTISHANLNKFLFSTLMMEPLAASTEPSFHTTIAPSSTLSYHDQGRKLGTIFEEETTPASPTSMSQPDNTHFHQTTGLLRELFGTTSSEGLIPSTFLPASSTEQTLEIENVTASMVSSVTTDGEKGTTHPKPMIFWSDKPDQKSSEEPRQLFEDELFAVQQPISKPGSLKDTIDDIPKQNLSREALDNLITILMKYVGQPDFLFNNADKKTLAEIIFWPIIHQAAGAQQSTSDHHHPHNGTLPADSSHYHQQQDHKVSSNLNINYQLPTTGDAVGTPWPTLKFIGPTPRMVDGIWVITAYAVYKDANSNQLSVIPRSKLLTLVHDSELRLMTKMNMQLSRIFPGLPTAPFNSTDRDAKNSDYHPLFERFSSLFIPLIVLAAICAFVATITVVCLVKKAQIANKAEKENQEKILRPSDVLGVDNPISDEMMKAGERSNSNSGNTTRTGTGMMSAKEMYETEGWPIDQNSYPPVHARKLPDEEDTKL